MKTSLRERLLSQLIIDLDAPRTVDDAPCWLWTGFHNEYGYGRINIQRRLHLVHRVTFEIFAGLVPDGLELDHLCRVRLCANPAHLEPVTRRINVLRGVSPVAEHARATHCPRGHPYDLLNTYINPSTGSRGCRICVREAGRRYAARKRRAT